MSTETTPAADGQRNERRRREPDGHRQPHRSQLRDPDRRRRDPLARPAPDPDLRRGLRPARLRPGVHEHGVVPQRDHLPRRRRRRARVPRLPDRAARRALDLPRGRLPARPRRAADRGPARGVDAPDHDPHLRARERQELHAGLPPRRAPDGHAARRGRRAVDVLPRRQPHPRRREPRDPDDPPDREDADARRVLLPPQRRACPTSTPTTTSATPATCSGCSTR